MNCPKARTLLVALADGELSGRDLVRVQEHLAACPDCAGELAELRDDAELLRAEPAPEVPPWLAARVLAHTGAGRGRRARGRAATAAAMTLASAVGLWLGITVGRTIVPPRTDTGSKTAQVLAGATQAGQPDRSAR